MKEENEDLYAPLGDQTFEKPQEQKEPEILSYKNVKLEYAEKPLNVAKLIKTFFVLLVIALVTTAVYLYQKNNKVVFKRGALALTNRIESEIYEIRGSKVFSFQKNAPFRDSFIVSFDASYDELRVSKEEKELLDMLEDVSASVSLDLDYKNKQFSYDVKTTYIGENMFQIYGNGNNTSITYKIKDVLGKFIRVPVSNIERIYLDNKTAKKDTDRIKTEMMKTLFLNIEEKDLKRTTKTISINGKKETVQDVYLTMDNAYFQDLFVKTLSDLKKSKTFIKNVMDYTDLTETRLKELLEEEMDTIKQTTYTKDTMTVHVLMQGFLHKIVGYEVEDGKQELHDYVKGKNEEIKWSKKEKTLFAYQKKQVSKNETQYDISYQNHKIKIDRLLSQNRTVFEYKYEFDGTYYYAGTLTLTEEEGKANKDGSIRITFKKFDYGNSEISALYATGNYNIKKMDKINLQEDKEAVLNKTLTEDDHVEIKRRIWKNEYLTSLKEKVEAVKKGLD